MIALLFALIVQDSARDLIERLQSDDPSVREEATRKLSAMGKAAEPELRKAADHPEPEVAGRVRRLLRNLEIAESLTPRLLAAVPNLVSRLTSGQPREWTAVLLQTQTMPSLGRPDLEPLAGPALRGAANDNETTQVLSIIQGRKLRSAGPDLVALFNHPRLSPQVLSIYRGLEGSRAIPAFRRVLQGDQEIPKMYAIDNLMDLDAVEALPDLRRLYKDSSVAVRARAARAVGALAGRDAVAELEAMARNPDPDVASLGLQGLGTSGVREAAPAVLAALGSADTGTQGWAAEAASKLRLKEAIPRIATMLQSSDETLLYDAISAMEEFGTRDAARALIPVLRHKDEDVREEAFRVLGDIGIREGTAEIAALLKSEEESLRVQAIDLLGALGAREHFDEVAKGLKDKSAEVKEQTVMALGAMDPARAAPLLVPLLADPAFKDLVEEWLYDATPKDAVPELRKLMEKSTDEKLRELAKEILEDSFDLPMEEAAQRLDEKDPEVRAAAVRALRTSEGIPLAVKALKDPDRQVRSAAVQALEGLKSPEVRGALADPDPEVLCWAIRAVAKLEIQEAARDLLALLRNPVGPVRQEAAEALGVLGTEEAAPALIEMAASPLPYFRASAAQGLSGLQSPEARAMVAKLQKDPHPYVRRMAAGPAAAPVNAAVPELVALLEDPRRETVRAAARKLLEKGTKEAVVAAARAVDLRDLGFKFEAPARLVPWIVELLGDPEDEVRGRAIGALSALGAREAVAPLVERLGGRDSIEILAALGELEAREAIPKMTPFLAHRRWAFRWQAAETLGRLRAQEAEAGLIRLLDDPTQDVRQTAALALGELGSARAVPKLLEMLVDENAPAGAALCLLGRPEGVPVVLSTAEEAVRLRTNRMFRSSTHRPSLLFALNALRSPELRRRLDAKKLEGPPAENFYELGRRVAADAGLEFESQGEDQVHLGEIDRLRGCTLWSGPFWVMAGGFGRGDHLEAILDEGKLRLVEHDDALRFWKAWHEKK